MFAGIFFLEEIQEVLLYFPDIKDISASAQIENVQTLKGIAQKCGYKVRIVATPNTDEKQEVVSKLNILLNRISIIIE